ncbi:MAG: PspC domain-containing protein [Eubacteriales bacterium]|nr:PspC domain-containing protein [Eubacteriales bacterium]MDD3349632.1 PspC domain-containing protein [Eubacteriales bacterium]
MEKKLYKSNENKVIAGVCGGIGEYFDIDPVIVRLLAVVFCLMGGAGIIAYIVAVIIIPSRTSSSGYSYAEGTTFENKTESGEKKNNKATTVTLGIILLCLGSLVILRYLIPWIPMDVIFAGLLVAGGIYFIIRKI